MLIDISSWKFPEFFIEWKGSRMLFIDTAQITNFTKPGRNAGFNCCINRCQMKILAGGPPTLKLRGNNIFGPTIFAIIIQ